MFKNVNQILIKAVTPIHAGVGRALGLIDMPIQKEKHTGIPKIEGSTIKGCMREVYRLSDDEDKTKKLFGPEDGNDSAGIVGFTDAKLLFYPVITLDGIFAYVTCPYLLNRFFEDKLLISNINTNKSSSNTENPYSKLEKLSDGTCVTLDNEEIEDGNNVPIVLDEYCFERISEENEKYQQLNLSDFNLKLDKQAIVISDNDFIEIISLCRDVITRNRISPETGVVDKSTGSLFTEEYLPAESILYTLVLQNGIEDKNDLYDTYIKHSLPKYAQIGGNATIGKGIVKIFNINDNNGKQNGERGGENSGSNN